MTPSFAEILTTKGTVWLAILCAATATGLALLKRRTARWGSTSRWLWTLGCGFFLAHVLAAFAFYHYWSHTAALLETARQTAELTGFTWGGGLYLNYLFLAVWAASVGWCWLGSAAAAPRYSWLRVAGSTFFWFMVFNGTVVFGNGPARWLGVAVFTSLATILIVR